MSEDKTKTLANDETKTPTTQPMLDVIIERLNNLYHQNEASQLLIEELRSDVKSRFEVLEAQQNELRSDMKSRFEVLETELRSDMKSRFEVLETQQNELRSDMKNRFDGLETQLNELREETQKGFRNIEHNLMVIARDNLQIKANQVDLHSRVEELERQAS